MRLNSRKLWLCRFLYENIYNFWWNRITQIREIFVKHLQINYSQLFKNIFYEYDKNDIHTVSISFTRVDGKFSLDAIKEF